MNCKAPMPPRPAQTSDNPSLLRELVEYTQLNLTLGPLFEQPAPCSPGPISWNRVRGMMLGLAIGDALGNTTEGQLPETRRQQRGEIRDYLSNRDAEHRSVGLPSDDSQLAFWTLEHLVECGGLVPDVLAKTFKSREIFGIGSAVRQFVDKMKEGAPWWQSSARSAGNGALMRIAPITIPHIRKGGPTFWSDAALCAAITHNDRGSIGACVAFAGMLSELLACRRTPARSWWVKRYVELARQVEGDNLPVEFSVGREPIRSTQRPSSGPAAALLLSAAHSQGSKKPGDLALRAGTGAARGMQRAETIITLQKKIAGSWGSPSVLQAGNTWYSRGWVPRLETVPTVLFDVSCRGMAMTLRKLLALLFGRSTTPRTTIRWRHIVGAAVAAPREVHCSTGRGRAWRQPRSSTAAELSGADERRLLGRTTANDDGRRVAPATTTVTPVRAPGPRSNRCSAVMTRTALRPMASRSQEGAPMAGVEQVTESWRIGRGGRCTAWRGSSSKPLAGGTPRTDDGQ